jgi:hypothetical protein
MDYAALRTELTTDPLVRGYAGMTDAQASVSLDTANRTLPRTNVLGADILRQTVLADYAALTAGQMQIYWGMVGCYGGVDPQDARTVAIFTSLFSGKATLTNLATLQTTAVSRAGELGLGYVAAGDVHIARSGVW